MRIGLIQDKILYSRLKYKDKQAFIKVYDLYLDNIYRFIYFKVANKEEAEDLTSVVFLKTWDYIQNNSISDYKTLKALLYKVARNLVIDHYRKKSARSDVVYDNDISLINIADKNQNLFRQVESKTDFEIIEKKLFELKDEYREVIILRYIDELSIAEIADAIEKSKGNVRVLIYRAIKALREIVETDNESISAV